MWTLPPTEPKQSRPLPRGSIELILMDLQMPDMDGLEATAAVRRLPGYENVPILALTANYSDEIRRQCQENGMQDFLSKPVTPTALWAAISRWLKLPE